MKFTVNAVTSHHVVSEQADLKQGAKGGDEDKGAEKSSGEGRDTLCCVSHDKIITTTDTLSLCCYCND